MDGDIEVGRFEALVRCRDTVLGSHILAYTQTPDHTPGPLLVLAADAERNPGREDRRQARIDGRGRFLWGIW